MCWRSRTSQGLVSQHLLGRERYFFMKFKKGHAAWNKGKKGFKMSLESRMKMSKSSSLRSKNLYSEEKNGRWKGDKVGYDALHQWVRRHLGKPGACEHCEKTGLSGKYIHWANKSHEYKRELSDWIRLCAKCHKAYDAPKPSCASQTMTTQEKNNELDRIQIALQ